MRQKINSRKQYQKILSILFHGDLLSIKIPKVQPLIPRISETIWHITAFLLFEMENNIYEYIRMNE